MRKTIASVMICLGTLLSPLGVVAQQTTRTAPCGSWQQSHPAASWTYSTRLVAEQLQAKLGQTFVVEKSARLGRNHRRQSVSPVKARRLYAVVDDGRHPPCSSHDRSSPLRVDDLTTVAMFCGRRVDAGRAQRTSPFTPFPNRSHMPKPILAS